MVVCDSYHLIIIKAKNPKFSYSATSSTNSAKLMLALSIADKRGGKSWADFHSVIRGHVAAIIFPPWRVGILKNAMLTPSAVSFFKTLALLFSP
jgi:hypothetical protein